MQHPSERTYLRCVSTCPSCEHHALQIDRVRAVDGRAELDLTCRACRAPALLLIAQRHDPEGDPFAGTIAARTTPRPPA